jgi:hypothetical protein
MEKQILQAESPEERIQALQNSADKIEKFSFPRELSNGEIQELQSKLSQDMIFVDQEEQKLKVSKEIFKSAVKPVKQQMAKNLTMIRTQVEEVTEDVYLLKDVQENKVGYYSKDGKLVFERSLRPEEMQFSIQEHLRKAN